ncbi:MAG: GrpB family protein, partial [Thermoplasmatota archaeon]
HQRYKDHLLFRDYLIDNRELAVRYGKLKLQLWRKYRGDREKYTEAKSDFIEDILDMARREYE